MAMVPYSSATARMSLLSELTYTEPMDLATRACIMDQASSDLPRIDMRFLPGIPLGPPRAGIITIISPIIKTIRVTDKAG